MRILPFPLLLLFALARLEAATGITPAGLEAAWDYSHANGGFALLVIQHGKTLMDRHAGGDSPSERHKIYSGTKGFWCVAALAAQADGLLDLDEPASNTLPEWRGAPGKESITLRQLLNFTGGLDPGFHLHSDDLADRDACALAMPEVARPGAAFIYGPSQIQVFCEVLRRKLAARKQGTPIAYLARRVLRPLGLKDVPYKSDAKGNPLMAAGFRLTAREWSRFGLCLLDDAHGILPPGALGECLRGSRANQAFGMGFWLNSDNDGREVNIEQELVPKWWQENWRDACLCRAAPQDLFVSLGSMGQRLYVCPSLGLVVVRLSCDSHFSDAEFLRLLLNAER